MSTLSSTQQSLGILRAVRSAKPADKGRSKWDDLVFKPLRSEPGKIVVVQLETSYDSLRAVEDIHSLNRKSFRSLVGLRTSRKRNVLTVWIEDETEQNGRVKQ